ncbi:DsrE family protein [Maribellus luteus]|uniref:DsrE family protein n=2 Tax=Maribellus luteus TaxID=2305463 RepID=A0A399T0B3_9BACT|nr:DsrE family protein [Maribellus luteus]
MNQEQKNSQEDKLVVVWTSDDPYVADRVALMYTHAAKTNKWFEDVTLIIWGPSAKLTSENRKIQEKLKAMKDDGVEIRACIACASAYGVTDDLKGLGFEVAGMGKPLTYYLKDDSVKVLTF